MDGSSEGVLVLYNIPLSYDGVSDAPCAEADAGVLDEVETVAGALGTLGVPIRRVGIRYLNDLPSELATAPESTVFNLVEALRGDPRDFNLVPALCRAFGKACTGGDTFCLVDCLNKWQTKAVLQATGVPTPEAVLVSQTGGRSPDLPAGPLIVKPLLTEASEGIDADCVFERPCPTLWEAVRRVHEKFGCPALVERYVRGRELNVSVIQRGPVVEVLPLAEIEFVGFPPDRAQIVGYRAKWLADTFEFQNTPRRIPACLPEPVVQQVQLCARRAWEALGCQDYARVDFRLDAELRPYVLEVNANPDLSPDAGFAAALHAAGISFPQFVQAILQSARGRLAGGPAEAAHVPAVAPGRAVPAIRWSSAEDRQAILKMAVGTHAFRPEEVSVACEVLDAALREGREGHYQSYTALIDGSPVGWVCFGPTPCTRGTFDLYWIMVAPQAQGAGTGKALISHVEELVAQRGGRMLVVEAAGEPAGDRAQGFYAKMGYEETARVKDFYAPGDDKVIYVKRIGPAWPRRGRPRAASSVQ